MKKLTFILILLLAGSAEAQRFPVSAAGGGDVPTTAEIAQIAQDSTGWEVTAPDQADPISAIGTWDLRDMNFGALIDGTFLFRKAPSSAVWGTYGGPTSDNILFFGNVNRVEIDLLPLALAGATEPSAGSDGMVLWGPIGGAPTLASGSVAAYSLDLNASAELYALNEAGQTSLLTGKVAGSMGVTGAAEVIALTQNTWAHLTNGTNDLLAEAGTGRNVTIDGDSIVVDNTGTYSVNCHISFSGANGDAYESTMYIDGVATTEPGLLFTRNTSSNDTGTAKFGGLVDLTAGEGLRIFIRNTGNNNDITIVNTNLSVVQIH